MAFPHLRHCTFVGNDGSHSLSMYAGSEFFVVEIAEGTIEHFFRVKALMDGTRDIGAISRKSGIRLNDVREIVALFEQFGLLRSERETLTVSPEELYQTVKSGAAMWKRLLDKHPLFAKLRAGAPDVFTGLLIETYHYVNSAPDHIASAIAACTDGRLRSILVRYFKEECDHGTLVRRAPERVGIAPEALEAAAPLLSTVSLGLLMQQIARRSTLGYFACLLLTEAREEERAEAASAFRSMCMANGFGTEVVEPLVEHMSGDADSEHVELFRWALDGQGQIKRSDADEVVRCVHDLRHGIEQFYDGIITYYSNSGNSVPRRQVDFRSI